MKYGGGKRYIQLISMGNQLNPLSDKMNQLMSFCLEPLKLQVALTMEPEMDI